MVCFVLWSLYWYHDALNWYIFFNWYHNVCFDFTPWSIFVSDKKGKNMFYWFSLTPLLMIDKKGRSIWVYWVYMHVFIGIKKVCFMFCWYWYQEYGYWYQEHYLKNMFILSLYFHLYLRTCLWEEEIIYLVSRACSLFYACLCIFMFSIHCIFFLFIAMHELRGSFFEA